MSRQIRKTSFWRTICICKSKIIRRCFVCSIPIENKNAIWCKLNRTYFNFHKDINLGTVHLSPSNFERSNSVDLIGKLEAEMLHFSQKGDIVVQGDFNARTREMQETISDDDNDFLKGRCHEDFAVFDQFWAKIITLRLYSLTKCFC